MPNTETPVSQLKINRLTKTQFDGASELSETELYAVDPEFTGGKLLKTDSDGNIVETNETIPEVDQTYDATSVNAQSGVAVASAISGKADDSTVVHKTGTETITGFKTLSAGAKITTTQSGAILELESATSGTNFLLKRTNGATCVVESGNFIGLLGTYSNHPFQIRTNYVNRMEFGTNGSVTLATAPSENSNDNQVATTAWTKSALSGYQTTSNLVTSVSSSSTDNQYPSAKLFYDICGDIETLINAL